MKPEEILWEIERGPWTLQMSNSGEWPSLPRFDFVVLLDGRNSLGFTFSLAELLDLSEAIGIANQEVRDRLWERDKQV